MAILLADVPSTEQLLAPRGPNTYPSGIYANDSALSRYALPSTDQPNLIINDPICDKDGNVITPGYYELTLSFDRQTFILSQSGNIIATIPVFKVEEDKSKEEIKQPMTNKEQKKIDKKKKKLEKKNKKLIRQGKMSPDPPPIYTKATIEYDVGGDYYLIKYERGAIKAWGAIKNEHW